MASAQRSIFVMSVTPGLIVGTFLPSEPRELPKGAQLLGAQCVFAATFWDPGVAMLFALEGRNGDTEDDWILVYQGSVTVTEGPTVAGPFSGSIMLGGADVLVPVQQFAEVRIQAVKLAGGPADLLGFTLDCHSKSDYLTG